MTAVTSDARVALEHKVISTHSHVDVPAGELAKRAPKELLPSEYLKRQGHACSMDDAVALHNRQFTGCQTLMFGTDYPHHEGTFPHTQEVIDRILAGVPEHETAMIVGGNSAKLYGFTLD